MKKLLAVLLILLSPSLQANITLIKQCESLQAKNQKIINAQDDPLTICTFNLYRCADHLIAACDSVAIDRFYQARIALDSAYTFLDRARGEKCKQKYLIPQLQTDIKNYKKKLV